MNEIYWAKVKPNAKIPTKRDEDAGYDVYACFDYESITILPHTTCMIPTGIASAFDKDKVAILKERGSTGVKGMGQRAGVIDSGFRGEWMVPITNHNDVPILLTHQPERYDKTSTRIVYPTSKAICQVLFFDVPPMDSHEISYESLKVIASERGLGKLGSSNK